MANWFEAEMDALDAQLAAGEISRDEYRREVAELGRDARDQQDREDIRSAGRGHLLRVAILATALALGLSGSADAGTTCTQIGNSIFCSGDGGNTTCTQIGNTLFCN